MQLSYTDVLSRTGCAEPSICLHVTGCSQGEHGCRYRDTNGIDCPNVSTLAVSFGRLVQLTCYKVHYSGRPLLERL